MKIKEQIGIISLVEDSTRSEQSRTQYAKNLLRQYIAEGIHQHLKRSMHKIFLQLDKLYRNKEINSRIRPKHYDHFVNYLYTNQFKKSF